MLEQVLEEIIEQLKAEGCIIDDDAGHRAEDIIRQYMNDGKDIDVPAKENDGWIPVEERLPEGKVNGKDDADKPVPHRVPPAIIWAIEKVRAFGCRKYPEDSWREVETQRYWDAAIRHMLAAWEDFRAVDPESGLPHIWHIACNLAFIISQEGVDNGLDREDSGRD